MSLFVILVPSFSSTQASAILYKLNIKLDSKKFIVLFSSIAISGLIFSFFMAYNFFKPRLGYISILLSKSILNYFNYFEFIIIVLISVCLIVFINLFFLKHILELTNQFNLDKVNLLIFIFTIIFVFIVSGFIGILYLIISFCIGYLPIFYNKPRIILLSFLMIPTLLYYL